MGFKEDLKKKNSEGDVLEPFWWKEDFIIEIIFGITIEIIKLHFF